MDWNFLRKNFLITGSNKIYLNHAAKSPMPAYVAESLHNFIRDRQLENIEYYPDGIEETMELKSLISEMINGIEENISLVQNTVSGLNICVDHIDWQKGDEIIIYEKDFPANVFPFLKLKEQYGVIIKVVKAENFILNENDYLNFISDKTKLISISHVQFLTGQVADLQKIGEVCRKNNILFVVDSIQSCGAINLDVKKFKIDFLSNGGHKWMMFPSGLGFIYFSKKFKEKCNDRLQGWLDRKEPFNFFDWDRDKYDDGRRFELGTAADMLVNGALRSMKERKKIGHDRIEKRILYLRKLLKEGISAYNLDLIDDSKCNFQSGIVSFRHKNAEELYNKLLDKNTTIAVRAGILRVSPHYYNNEDDISRFLTILKQAIS